MKAWFRITAMVSGSVNGSSPPEIFTRTEVSWRVILTISRKTDVIWTEDI